MPNFVGNAFKNNRSVSRNRPLSANRSRSASRNRTQSGNRSITNHLDLIDRLDRIEKEYENNMELIIGNFKKIFTRLNTLEGSRGFRNPGGSPIRGSRF